MINSIHCGLKVQSIYWNKLLLCCDEYSFMCFFHLLDNFLQSWKRWLMEVKTNTVPSGWTNLVIGFRPPFSGYSHFFFLFLNLFLFFYFFFFCRLLEKAGKVSSDLYYSSCLNIDSFWMSAGQTVTVIYSVPSAVKPQSFFSREMFFWDMLPVALIFHLI